MNEECLLKYLLNPNELEVLTELLQKMMNEPETVNVSSCIKNGDF